MASPSSALTMAKPKSAVLGGGRKRMSQTEEGVLLHSRETFDATEWEAGGGDDDDVERAGLELELEAAYAGADPPPNPAQSEARRAAHGAKPRLFAGRGGDAADDTKAVRKRASLTLGASSKKRAEWKTRMRSKTHDAHRTNEDAHLNWSYFFRELLVSCCSPLSVLPVWLLYGWGTVVNKHMIPSGGPLLSTLFLIECWCPLIVNVLVFGLGVRSMYVDVGVMNVVLLFRFNITALRYGFMPPAVRRTIYHSRDRGVVETAHANTQLLTAWLCIGPEREEVLLAQAMREAGVDPERPIACRREDEQGGVCELSCPLTVEKFALKTLQVALGADDALFGYKHFRGIDTWPIFNWRGSGMVRICYFFAFAITFGLPLLSRHVGYGSLGATWRDATGDGGANGGAATAAGVACLYALISVVNFWESLILSMFLFVAIVDLQRLATVMRVLRVALQRQHEVSTAQWEANRGLRIDVSVGNNAAVWIDVRKTFLHFGSTFRLRTTVYMGLTLALNSVLVALMLWFMFRGADEGEVLSGLYKQRKSLIQTLTAFVSFFVISVLTALVVQGDATNRAWVGHKCALVARQLEVRERADEARFAKGGDRIDVGDAAVARLDRSDAMISAVVSSLEMQSQYEPITLFGLAVGSWMLTSAALGFLSTAAIVVRVLTFDVSKAVGETAGG